MENINNNGDKYFLRLAWKMHIITINMEDRGSEDKYFDSYNIAEVIKKYQELKEARAYGLVEYNTDFRLFRMTSAELNLEATIEKYNSAMNDIGNSII